MYNLIKKIVFAIIGRRNSQKIANLIRGRKAQFSEADLIFNYFNKFKRLGIMIDVGVHFGESSLPYSEMNWKIWGFEPDPNNRKLIPKIKNLKLYDYAISDKDGDIVSFYGSEESSGISSLSAFRDSHTIIAQVETRTLGTILSEEDIKEVDFLKIDIEGHDFFALKGFPFERIKPEVIVCEFEDYKTKPLGYDYKDLGDFITAQGYTVYLSEWDPIVKYGSQHNWRNIRRYPSSLENEKGWGNFIAVRSDQDFKFDKVLKSYLKQF